MPVWVERDIVLAIHADQIAEHGGLPGLRDQALLDSALARPRQQAAYGVVDLCDLAAAYAFGIARNHPFLDGNKRVSFVVAAVFLQLNGLRAWPRSTTSWRHGCPSPRETSGRLRFCLVACQRAMMARRYGPPYCCRSC
jgi:death-on-curing protein